MISRVQFHVRSGESVVLVWHVRVQDLPFTIIWMSSVKTKDRCIIIFLSLLAGVVVGDQTLLFSQMPGQLVYLSLVIPV